MNTLDERKKWLIELYAERMPVGGRLAALALGLIGFFRPGLLAYMIVKTVKKTPIAFPHDPHAPGPASVRRVSRRQPFARRGD
jgi:hypothetical protein